MQIIKQNDPRAIKRRVYFTCVDTTALLTRLQSSDMSTFTVVISKNGATAGAVAAAAPTQVDATNAKGLFYVELALADISAVGTHTLVITNAGGTKAMEKREIFFEVDTAFFATAATGTLTTASFTSDRTEGTDFWKDNLVRALTGALTGQVKKVGASVAAGGLITLATGFVFTAAPANGDIFELVSR